MSPQRRDTNTHLRPAGQPTFSDHAPHPAPFQAPGMRRGPNNNNNNDNNNNNNNINSNNNALCSIMSVLQKHCCLPAHCLKWACWGLYCINFFQISWKPRVALSQPIVHFQRKHTLEAACQNNHSGTIGTQKCLQVEERPTEVTTMLALFVRGKAIKRTHRETLVL